MLRKYTDQELLNRVAALPSFKGFGDGILEIWVRAKDNKREANTFNDKVYTFDCRNGEPKFIMVCTGTSHAGFAGLKHYERYNPKGCAVLLADHIQYNSHILGKHKGKYSAFVENPASPFPYTRDTDKDDYAEVYGKIYHDNIGANMHHAGFNSPRLINGWSVACLVRNSIDQWNAWLGYVTKTARQKKVAATAILNEF